MVDPPPPLHRQTDLKVQDIQSNATINFCQNHGHYQAGHKNKNEKVFFCNQLDHAIYFSRNM
jgi:acetylornithine/succinyldiaminopimelate/putrescine aminotransferase